MPCDGSLLHQKSKFLNRACMYVRIQFVLMFICYIWHYTFFFPGPTYFYKAANCCIGTVIFMPLLGRCWLPKLCTSTYADILIFSLSFFSLSSLSSVSVAFQSLSCHEYNEVLHKDAALMIIKVCLKSMRFEVNRVVSQW